MDIIIVLFYLLGMKKRRNKEFKKKLGANLWKYRAGRADEASSPMDEASSPTDEASPIGPYIFSLFFLFFNVFFLSAAGVSPSESALKTTFLRTYVDLLNYPFKSEVKKLQILLN